MPRPWTALGAIAAIALAVCTGSRTPADPPLAIAVTAPGAAGAATDRPATELTPGDIATLLRRDFGLPLPPVVRVYLYRSPERFEHGLVAHGRVAPQRAALFADFAAGVAVPGAVLLRMDAGGSRAHAEWTRLVTHELTHLAQHELTRGEPGAAQWLVEGMAEWVAYSLLERVGLAPLDAHRARARAAAEMLLRDNDAPSLAELTAPAGFLADRRRHGAVRTYQLAFTLTDAIVVRAGFKGLLDYFTLFRESRDGGRNFERAFGVGLERFEADTWEALEGP